MANTDLLRRVASALSTVTNPRTGKDLVLSGQVKELTEEGRGHVRFRLLLQPGDPAGLADEARQAAEMVDGVQRVTVDAETPAAATGEPGAAGARPGGTRRP
ncbi:MAG: iron-sulfur cluster assembly protein, partial [Gemmatimonadota bacterium]